MKNRLLKVLLVMSLLPINVLATNDVEMSYEVPETEGSALFHLDTSLVAFTKDSLEKDINYHITTNKGNYYYGNGYKQYNVFIDDDILTDSHGNDVELSVTFNNNQAQGTLNLNETVTDETTYTGRVISTSESTDVAGDYSTSVVVNFNLDDKLMKLASNVYTIHRGVTADTNYVEVPGVANGTTVAELRNNFLNTEGTINVYDENGNLIEDENKVVTTAMSVQLEDVPSDISTFSLKTRAVNTINDKLGIAIPGDVDGDGEVTQLDLKIINDWILYINNNIFLYFNAADMNKDGYVNTADFALVNKKFWELNSPEPDKPFLYGYLRKTLTYNNINYIKDDSEDFLENVVQNVISIAKNTQDYGGPRKLFGEWENGYWKYKAVYYDENGIEINTDNLVDDNGEELYSKTGIQIKLLKAYYDTNKNFLYYGDYIYDTLLYIIDGDVNSDGSVDENDVIYLTQAMNGEVILTTAQKLAADRNNDGIINQADLDIYNN